MHKLTKRLRQILNFIVVILFASLCLIVFLNVVVRTFVTSFIWSVELSRFIFVYLILISSIIALQNKTHYKVDIFVNKLPTKFKKVIDIINNFLILLVLIMFLVGSYKITNISIGSVEATTGISFSVLYGIGIFSSAAMIIITIIDIFAIVQSKENNS